MTGSPEQDEVSTERSSVSEWMRALGRATGNPGGGAASGLMLSIAAGLTAMVAGYTEPEHASAGGTERGGGTSGSGDDPEATITALRARAEARSALALRLADADAEASHAFGSAFRRPRGPERDEAIRAASIGAAAASARLGEHAVEAVDDLAWLARHGNPALIADVAVAIGALRAAITGARTNVSFDLGSVRSAHESLEEVRRAEPALFDLVPVFDRALERIDRLAASIDADAAPTE